MSTRAAATLALTALAALLLTVAPAPATAQTAAPTAQANADILAIEVGYAGQFWPGHHVVLRARVQPTRLVNGYLLVRGPSGEVRRNVEVAGGSVKEFLFILPTQSFVNSVEVSVELRRGGAVLRQVDARAAFDPDVEVVGLLPGAVGNSPVPAPAPLAVDAGVAHFDKLTALELGAAPGSLDGLQVIAAAAGELAGLGDDAAAAIGRWVAGGGRLLVDEAPGAVVPGLPGQPDLRTDATGRVDLGAGEVVAVNGAIAGARWAGLVEPSARTVRDDGGFSGGVNGVVAREANVRQAGLGGLTVFLLLYVLVVGPVLFLVLSRTRRRHLAWIGVPGVAIVFTVGAYVVGRDLRSGARPAHATVLVVQGEQAEARTAVGLVSQRGGTKKIRFPRQWTAIADNSFRSGPFSTNEAVESADGLTVPIPLGPGEFGVATGTGPVRLGGSLEVTGFIDGTGLATGKVVNRLPFALDRVAVTVGDQATVISRVEAGGEAAWTTGTDPTPGSSAHPALQAWFSSVIGPGNRAAMFDPSSPDAALLDTALRMADLTSDGTTVAAMGWTRDYKPPVRAGSGMVGPTLVATLGNLALPSDGAPGTHTTSVAFLRGRLLADGMAGGRGILMPEGRASLIRLRSLNPTLNPAKANLRVTGFAGTVQVWAAGKWVDVDFTNAVGGAGQQNLAQAARRRVMPAPCPPGADCVSQGVVMIPGNGGAEWQEVTVPLPKGAMVNGSVYVRVTGQEIAVGNRYEVLPA